MIDHYKTFRSRCSIAYTDPEVKIDINLLLDIGLSSILVKKNSPNYCDII